ncbi:tetratricopeptide repeat protein [Rhodoferax sp.]|uniref:O-linked N-acetylglucosamine transferase, SPINDLY family protein n=1 Tax=Rhodoferax sp. TaxID=50421 RepID=UPI0025E75878|nr:tetratricopeptide repeat protein [Rhodoferax sp.]
MVDLIVGLDPAQVVLLALLEGEACEARQDYQRAILHYMEALAVNPQHVDVWCRLGRIFMLGPDWNRAIEVLETALHLSPGLPYAQKFLALAHFNLGHRDLAITLIEEAARHSHESNIWVLRAWIRCNIDKDPARTLAVFQDWGRRFADPLTRKAVPFQKQDRRPGKKLRVGYVTADFRVHSIAFFMQPVLQHHDPEQVEIYVYSGGKHDYITEAMQQDVPHWHDTMGMSDDALYQLIRSHQIDVLVDLSGHTAENRLLVFARRAAPVQVTWLGFMNTLGMKGMDYRLTDGGTDPLGNEVLYTEKLFRLQCMASYVPPRHAPLLQQLPMETNGYPTLISLNNSFKVTDAMLRVWARILALCTDARLLIMVKESTPDAAQAAMQPRVEEAGLPIERVSVVPQLLLEQFMELGFVADVALDTSPVSGGTTTLHALWMGLPVVALDAQRAIDSSSARILGGIGLGELVASDEDAYVRLTVELLQNPERLAGYRASTRTYLTQSVLMDYPSRTAEVEAAYRLMWLNYLCKAPRYLDSGCDVAQALRAAEGFQAGK